MRVWIDVTNSPHVPFFRPLIDLLARARARRRASRRVLRADARAARRRRASSTTSSALRTAERARPGRPERWPCACARSAVGPRPRGSTSRCRTPRTSCRSTARPLRIPSRTPSTTSSRAPSTRSGAAPRPASSCPDAIPQERLDALGARAAKVRRYAGLKEEYYLARLHARPGVLDELGLDRARVLVVVRTPPEVSLYHRHGSPLFTDVLERLGTDPAVRAVVLPRTAEQRDAIVARALPSLVVPAHAVDAQSLVRAGGPRRLGGRHHEPRGGRARHARRDDLRRTARRGRRGSSSAPAGCASLTDADGLVLEKKQPAARPRDTRSGGCCSTSSFQRSRSSVLRPSPHSPGGRRTRTGRATIRFSAPTSSSVSPRSTSRSSASSSPSSHCASTGGARDAQDLRVRARSDRLVVADQHLVQLLAGRRAR